MLLWLALLVGISAMLQFEASMYKKWNHVHMSKMNLVKSASFDRVAHTEPENAFLLLSLVY